MQRSFVLAIGFLAITLAAVAAAGTPLQEYVDPQYQFSFQYPSDWTLDATGKLGATGEMRAVVRDSQSSARAIASIGQVGKRVTKDTFESSPNREMVVQAMIELALKQIYERASKELHAERMVVAEKHAIPSDVGIKFYISTVHVIGDTTVIIAGIHVVPFEKSHMVSFIMVSPFKLGGTRRIAINKVFNSFRLVTEPKK